MQYCAIYRLLYNRKIVAFIHQEVDCLAIIELILLNEENSRYLKKKNSVNYLQK